MIPADRPSLEDVLINFATSEESLDHRLASFLSRFREYEAALKDLAVELLEQPWATSTPERPIDLAAAAAQLERFKKLEERFGRTVAPTASDTAHASSTLDPFAALDSAGLQRVALNFGCTILFIGRLKDRVIRAEDFTVGFLNSLAAALNTTKNVLEVFLSGPARVPAAVRFKADEKPIIGAKQSLGEALDTSGLTDAQKRHLASL